MLTLILTLLILGLLLLLAEVFVPGLVLGIGGFILLPIGVVLSFHHYGAATGSWVFAGTAVGVLAVFGLGMAIFPRTRMGRKVFLSERVVAGPTEQAAEQERKRLIGLEGKAMTDLRPAGIGLIEGRRWDVITDGSYITQGEPFCVVRVEGPSIVVRPKEM
ncbi:MAG: hypothetical protein N3D11_00410 [Candidatus Sumerlaeia bacterium]|nr:hypothetical protein [Candidatus Sumerlaeia bacterium]